MEPIFYGFLTGVAMSLMLGTVFFALIQNSIEYGVRSGMFIATGVILSDIILISLSFFHVELLPAGGSVEMWIRLFGGSLLIVYAVSSLRKRRKIEYRRFERGGVFFLIATGFMLNILNPGNFIGWLAVSTQLTQVAGYSLPQCLLFFAGALSAIFCTEILIAFSASLLKKILTDVFLRRLDIAVGVLFLGFAGFMLWPVPRMLISRT
ncbi:MAG: hypothetical protein OHK0019_04350 [Saprospiraceae bacterium]